LKHRALGVCGGDFGSESCIIVKAQCCWTVCECRCLWILQKSHPGSLLFCTLRLHTYILHSTETALEQTKPISMTCYFTSCCRVSPVLD